MDVYAALSSYADDSHLNVVTYCGGCLKLQLVLDCEDRRQYWIVVPRPIHLGMPPEVILGRIEFGDFNLLPPDYEASRYKGYEGDEDSWRVMKMMDDEGNEYYAIYTGQETIEPS